MCVAACPWRAARGPARCSKLPSRNAIHRKRKVTEKSIYEGDDDDDALLGTEEIVADEIDPKRGRMLVGGYAIFFLRYCIATFISPFFSDICQPDKLDISPQMQGLIFTAFPAGIAITATIAPKMIMTIGAPRHLSRHLSRAAGPRCDRRRRWCRCWAPLRLACSGGGGANRIGCCWWGIFGWSRAGTRKAVFIGIFGTGVLTAMMGFVPDMVCDVWIDTNTTYSNASTHNTTATWQQQHQPAEVFGIFATELAPGTTASPTLPPSPTCHGLPKQTAQVCHGRCLMPLRGQPVAPCTGTELRGCSFLTL